MVTYIKSDLEFILKQIKISEADAAFRQGISTGDPLNVAKPLFGPGGSIPAYNIAWGLRTVDGSYNHLLPGQEQWGASDREFNELVPPEFRTVLGPVDTNGPNVPNGVVQFPFPYTPGNDADGAGPNATPGDVIDPSVRTTSNLIVDQTLSNPAAIVTALTRNGIAGDLLVIASSIMAAYEPLKPLFKAVDDALDAYSEAQAAADVAVPPSPALDAAAAAALVVLQAAQTALADARALDADGAGPGVSFDDLLAANGVELSGANVVLPNIAPDEGLSAPFNSWFTLFGQFFDHGLDLVNKGGNGTVFIPLTTDDPLYNPDLDGADNIAGTADDPNNFMVLTRATTSPGADGILGDNPATPLVDESLDDGRPVNTTTAYVDQNQTYTSHPSHQVFLRQYVMTADGPRATGHLIEGNNGGMANWGELKVQTSDMLGFELLDQDVGSVPLLRTDPYGNFIRGTNGFPLAVTDIGPDGIPNTADDLTVEGNPAANGGLGVSLVGIVRTNQAFLADIAHNAVPDGLADGDITIGLDNGDGSQTDGNYDDELLDRHFIAGDGRVNENIGLTAVHHVFHAEHNRLADHTKEVVVADAQAMLLGGASHAEAVAFLNEWLEVDVATVPTTVGQISALVWDGERLFQAAKFGTEMQYQHLVFEEFARKVTPSINTFLVPDGFDTTLDPTIVAEFAHTVYRFGHSMLNEDIERFDANFNADHIGLIQGFLNPVQFDTNGTVNDAVAAGDIIRGMTRQTGNHIDEFVTSALRNNLLGLPLDLATINLARGRDTGVPTLQDARRSFYEMTNQDAQLKPYESWTDFALNLKNEVSIINFIAAYGTHPLITGQTTIEGKRDAALTIITGNSVGGLTVPTDRLDFLNATGTYAPDGVGANDDTLGGLDNVDLWIGGLAERTMPFGGMLGSTFQFVFERQMENLQSGDRFYYLQRLDGLHLFGEMEANSFAAMIMRNTNATHLPSDVFSAPGLILEVNQARQFNDSNGDGVLDSLDPLGPGLLTQLVIRNNPATPGADTNYLRYTGGDHVVLGGTDSADTLIGGIGDDTLHGDGGNDKLEGGFGNDIINAGAGDDIIVDIGGDDNVKAGDGNDVVHAGPGLDLILGGAGTDFIFLGTDEGSEVFAGTGDDFVYGNKNAERILGNEGSDWIETGTFDGAPGDNFDEVFAQDEINGHDVFLGDGGFDEFIGEGGNDIMVGSAGRGKMVGMSGFDWATYKDNTLAVNADLSIPIIFDEAPVLPQNAALDEYESVEGLSGTKFNDILTGTEDLAADRAPLAQGGTTGYRGSVLTAEGIALIQGLQELLGAGVTTFDAGDIILGGDGSDTMRGNGGDDILDGDKWLDVQIGVYAPGDVDHEGAPIALHNSMTTLAASMFNGSINPAQLGIVRTIRNSNDQTDSDGIADVDRAVFSGARAEYDIDFSPDGTITVAHVGGTQADGTDTVRNVEVLDFTDQDVLLQVPTLDLHGPTTATTTATVAQAYRDEFASNAYNLNNGASNWNGNWTETNDGAGAGSPTAGDIQVAGGRLQFNNATDGGEYVARAVNLAGVTRATLSFSWEADDLDGGNETVSVEARNSTTGAWTTIGTFGGDTTGSFSQTLAAGLTGANTQIRFIANGSLEGDDNFYIDNVNIQTEIDTLTPVPGAPGNNYAGTFTEDGGGVAIVAGPVITDDGTTIASARVVLTNASDGDTLSAAGLPAGITAAVANVAGQITLTLTGNASPAAYQTALQQVRFNNPSNNPSTVARVLQVTVNDGLLNSAIATATISVVAQNDAPVGNADTVITNVAAGTTFSIARSALLANDTDPEGSALSITAVGSQSGLNAPALGVDVVTVSDLTTGPAGGSFNYVVSDGALTDAANLVTVVRQTGTITGTGTSDIIVGDTLGTTINGNGGNDNINAGDGSDTIVAGTGDDIILGGTGNDTIVWNTNLAGSDTDGFDMVNGQEGGADTFVVNGRGGLTETFRIYARQAALDAGIPVTGADSEIIITRTVGATMTVIAELDNIEEISVNTLNTTANNGNNPNTPDGGAANGDTIQVIGNFNSPFTSLNFSTITIDGNAGDDTVDISALSSAHRIVFKSNGGHDTIVGSLRPQDVIELPEGMTLDDFDETTDENGVTTLTNGQHSISYVATGDGPQIGGDDDEDDENDDHEDDDDCDDDDDDDASSAGGPVLGTPQDDVLLGTSGGDLVFGFAGTDYIIANAGVDVIRAGAGDDFVDAGAGRDVVFADDGDDDVFGGDDDDLIYGEAGDDRLFGGSGNDLIDAGADDDTVFGGAGNDLFVGSLNDGNDTYYGGEISGDAGNDTLDLAFLTANATVDLGTGVGGRGSAVSSQSGTDTLYGVENVTTGSGDDVITMSNAVNVVDGGAGEDIFVFGSATAAHGDTIKGFEAGDKIDLSGIDANAGVAGNNSFTLQTSTTAPGQIVVTHETREDGEYTVISGNTAGDNAPEFRISIAGNHALTGTDFNL
ncbi:peroxidase family protein [Devosia sp.]|uniref:peroxidase family protein n=1 Tax=Devosia sp. TaxID=1871048 RepID=UPI0025E9F398|nr:peroxidase family protein [Devosia sp.]MCR6636555.1 Ig-like domain-containing protein [Devosia sp.]